MSFKSILKPEASTMAALATVGVVASVYAMSVGPVSQAHATDANHPSLESSRKKAGYMSLGLVSALFLITRDGNVATLGFASIIGAEIVYRHGIMVAPATGKVIAPDPNAYTEAGDPNNVVSMTDSDVA